MPQPTLQHVLETAGLSDREIPVYLALLELGESPVHPIAKAAGIKRTNTYDILNALAAKGLASFFDRGKIRHFVAEDPASLEKTLKERLSLVSESLPELRGIFNRSASKPKVRFYDGKEGLLNLYLEMEASPAFDALGSPGKLFEHFENHFEKQGETTVPKMTRIRELITPEMGMPPYTKDYVKPIQEVRFLPKNMTLRTDMVLFAGKLVLFSYEPDIHAIVIEGSSIVEDHQKMFDYMWEMTKETVTTA